MRKKSTTIISADIRRMLRGRNRVPVVEGFYKALEFFHAIDLLTLTEDGGCDTDELARQQHPACGRLSSLFVRGDGYYVQLMAAARHAHRIEGTLYGWSEGRGDLFLGIAFYPRGQDVRALLHMTFKCHPSDGVQCVSSVNC